MTSKKISMKQELTAWWEIRSAEARGEHHLSEEEIIRLTAPGAINQAGELLEHLSLCPVCLKKWVKASRQRMSGFREKELIWSDDYIVCGMVEAAATGPIEKPLTVSSLPSEVGRFSLGVYPDHDNPGKVLITLDVEQAMRDRVEGRKATVRGKDGRILLHGIFRGGRVAGISEKLTGSDLAQWTVIVAGND